MTSAPLLEKPKNGEGEVLKYEWRYTTSRKNAFDTVNQ